MPECLNDAHDLVEAIPSRVANVAGTASPNFAGCLFALFLRQISSRRNR